MSLQAILERIQAVGDAQVQVIDQEAQARAGEILAQAYIEAEQIEADAREEASAPGNAERSRIFHRARLDALHVLGGAREDLVDSAIARTRERLASLRVEPSYPTVMQSLTEEALAQLTASEGAVQPQLQADPRDRELLQNILAGMKLDLPVRYELNTWGGLIAASADGRVVVINTLEARLDQAMPFLRRHLAAYFEEEKTAAVEQPHTR